MPDQLNLFGAGPALPEGFRYAEGVIPAEQEHRLLAHVQDLPFREFEFQGYTGKRRVVSFGWRYDFNERALREADPLPVFLLAVREVTAAFAGLDPAHLQQALVTEYSAGAAIGWHRDKSVFGEVVGVSLASACQFRLRRKHGSGWDRVTLRLEPRSAYLLSGPARTEWEHSIPPVDVMRYSITFRNLVA